MKGLRAIPTDVLLEEIARRARCPDRWPRTWCHDCRQFRTYIGKGDPPDDYDPCALRLNPRFYPPRDYGDICGPESYGFARVNCDEFAPSMPKEIA